MVHKISLRGIANQHPDGQDHENIKNVWLLCNNVYRKKSIGEKGKNTDQIKFKENGAEGDRTPGLLIANQSLSQLSYSPVCVDNT